MDRYRGTPTGRWLLRGTVAIDLLVLAVFKYANFIDVPTDTRMCYPPETFDRLQAMKARYDADDLFRANHPIPCVAAAA